MFKSQARKDNIAAREANAASEQDRAEQYRRETKEVLDRSRNNRYRDHEFERAWTDERAAGQATHDHNANVAAKQASDAKRSLWRVIADTTRN